MLTPEQSADQVFENIKGSIIESCKAHDWAITRRAVTILGFTESNVSSNFGYAPNGPIF